VASLALLACRSSGPSANAPATPDGARERALFEAVLKDLGRDGGAAGLNTSVLDAQQARFDQVVAWHDGNELVSGPQNFWAGAALVRSDEPSHLVLAESLGASAVVLGERRGLLVQAEARDRTAMLVGEPQPFGTQMVFVPITGEWRLYSVDSRTTDDERRAFDLPTLREFQAKAQARNSEPLTKRLREELIHPGNLPR